MSSGERGDAAVYTAVANGEEQYSIRPADREFPLGGDPGSKQEVLARIEEVWTDMRSLSLRRKMGEAGLTAG
jgi:MbtH protein